MFSFGSVRQALTAVVLLAMLPAMGLILFSTSQDRARDIAENIKEAEEAVQAMAYREQNLVENTRILLLAISLFDEVANQDIPAVRSLLRTVLRQTPIYNNLAFVSPEGKMLASAKPSNTCKGMTEIIGKSKSFVVGSLGSSEAEELPHMHFAFPVIDKDDKLTGYITGGLHADNFSHTLKDKNLFPGAAVLLMDGDGTIFASHEESAAYDVPSLESQAGMAMQAMLRQRIAETKSQRGSFRDTTGGTDAVHLFRSLYLVDHDAPYLTVVLSVPYSALAAWGNATIKLVIVLVLASLLFALISIRLFGQGSISEPLGALVNTAKKIRHGDISSRVDTDAFNGDMRVLAVNFNTMAEALESREKERILAKSVSDQNNEAKSEFLAAMSHAIRTPMNSVIGIAYLLMKTPLDKRQHGYVNRIYTSASTLLGIINDILDFSNIEAGRFTMEHVPFQLSETLDNVIALCSEKAEERQLRLVVDVAPDVPDTLVGDPLRLAQILTNLISNSVKFTERGQVLVTCQTEEAEGNTDEEPAAKRIMLRFAVADTGIGMTSQQIAGLFSSFSQADETISRRFGGTGLGLAISNKLVALMHGSFDVQSKYGKGTTMSFTASFGHADSAYPAYVPGGETAGLISSKVRTTQPALPEKAREAATTQAPEEPGAAPSAPPLLAGCPILLVEDNPVNLEVAKELLSEAGAIITTATNGAEAVAFYAGPLPPFRLIIMDVRMPVMDGFEATKILREKGVTTPIIAMTAYAMAEERESCLEAGMDAHISKPIEIDKFFSTIAECLDKKPGQPAILHSVSR